MFTFPTTEPCHMPFVTPDEKGNPVGFCCLWNKATLKWNIYYNQEDKWERLNTHTPEGALECGPTAIYSYGMWTISFISNNDKDPAYYLYALTGPSLKGPFTLKQMATTSAGFCSKGGTGAFVEYPNKVILIAPDRIGELELPDVSIVYRLSYVANNMQNLLISGRDINNNLFSWCVDVITSKRRDIRTPEGEPAYKCAMFNYKLWYAKKLSDSFEDRQIVELPNPVLVTLDRTQAFELPYEKQKEYKLDNWKI